MTRIADFGVFVQIEGLVEGLMHVSETALPRGEKPQEHYHEGDPIRVRILRIDEAEMKVGLSGVDEGGQPLEAAPAASAGEAAPQASAETAAEAGAPAEQPSAPTIETPAAQGGEEGGEGEAAPKKRRARKKTEEPKT